MDEKHQAKVLVTPELLADMLFPKGTRILSIEYNPYRKNCIEFIVENPDLPPVATLAEIPWISPAYLRVHSKEPDELDRVFFQDWGLPKDYHGEGTA
jgi:hypothetical protein